METSENKAPQTENNTNTSANTSPNISAASIFKMASSAFFIATFRLIFFVVFGLALNIAIFIMTYNDLDVWRNNSSNLLTNILGYVAPILLLFIFPLLFYVFGQKHALKAALFHVVSRSKEFLFVYFTDKLFDFVNKNPKTAAMIKEGKLTEVLSQTLPNYLEKLQGMSFVFKGIFTKFSSKINFTEIFATAQTVLGANATPEAIKNFLATEANKRIPVAFLSPASWVGFFILTIINLLMFAAIYLLAREKIIM